MNLLKFITFLPLLMVSLFSANITYSFESNSYVRNIAFNSNIGYVFNGDIEIYSDANTSFPTLLQSVSTTGTAYDGEISNGYLFVADGSNGLYNATKNQDKNQRDLSS